MFDHIAKRRKPSPVPFDAIAAVLLGGVAVFFMIRMLRSSPAAEQPAWGRAPVGRPAAAALPALTPSLEAVAGPAMPVDGAFGWRPPCRVPAVQDTDKDGQRSRMSFDVALEPDGNVLALRIEHVEVLAVNGMTADAPGMRPQLRRVEALAGAAMPTFLVSTDGDYVGVADLDRTLDALARAPELGAQRHEAIAAMRAPQMRAVLEQAAGGYWNAWFGAWHGVRLAPGEQRARTSELRAPGDRTIKVPSTIRHHGAVVGAPGLVVLEEVQVLEGAELAQVVQGTLGALAAQGGGPAPGDDVAAGLRRTSTVRVAIDPATSRVHRARSEVIVELAGRRQVKIDDIAFDWTRAVGCGAP